MKHENVSIIGCDEIAKDSEKEVKSFVGVRWNVMYELDKDVQCKPSYNFPSFIFYCKALMKMT